MIRRNRRGSLVGAAIGAVARAIAVGAVFHEPPLALYALSGTIGAVVGWIAGGTGKPLRGACLGAFLSAIVCELIMLAIASAFDALSWLTPVTGAMGKVDNVIRGASLVMALVMGVAGALAGGIGGWVGGRHASGAVAAIDS